MLGQVDRIARKREQRLVRPRTVDERLFDLQDGSARAALTAAAE